MQIVIDVDMDSYVHDAEGTDYFIPDLHTYISENMLKILKEKGKVLPKGHGDLIDRDALKISKEWHTEMDEYNWNVEHTYYTRYYDEKEIKNAPTIIKADKEVEE